MKTPIRSVQILRAVGASAVVYYHSVDAGGKFMMPSTGPWGVDLFFVISGFVIGLVAVSNTKHFFLRRVFRVVPLYTAATLAWATAVLLIPQRANSTEVTPLGLVKSLLFIPYEMPQRDGPILQLGWTLNYEMFFYLAVALSLLLLRKQKLALLVTALFLSGMVLYGYVSPASSFVLATYQSPLLLEFLAGVGISLLFTRGAFEKLPRVVDIFALLIMLAAFWVLIAQDTGAMQVIASHRAFYYGGPAVLIVLCGLILEKYIADTKTVRVLLILGSASYAMYLFHPFVAVFLSEIVLAKLIADGNLALHLLLFGVVYTAVALVSIAIDRYADQPLQKYLRNRLR